jgi:hypothetical protein
MEDEKALQSVPGGFSTLPTYDHFASRSRVQGAHSFLRTDSEVDDCQPRALEIARGATRR